MNGFFLCLAGVLTMVLAGCGPASKSARGFRLPDGNIDRGKAAFVALQCNECHEVEGVELPPPARKPKMALRLGGEVINVKTYGELVTSVINPSHKLAARYRREDISHAGQTLMTDCSDIMTVRQMIDLVAFLQSCYQKTELESWRYQ